MFQNSFTVCLDTAGCPNDWLYVTHFRKRKLFQTGWGLLWGHNADADEIYHQQKSQKIKFNISENRRGWIMCASGDELYHQPSRWSTAEPENLKLQLSCMTWAKKAILAQQPSPLSKQVRDGLNKCGSDTWTVTELVNFASLTLDLASMNFGLS